MTEWEISVQGEAIAKLEPSLRWAKIIEPSPVFEKDSTAENGEKQKPKLIVNVELPDGRKAVYYPNKTSGRFIASILSTDFTAESMKAWVGHKIVWGSITDMMLGGQAKKVLYVTSVD